MKELPMKSKALAVLLTHKGRWRQIAQETELGYDWMSKLFQGCIDDPGAAKLEKIIKWGTDFDVHPDQSKNTSLDSAA